MEHEGDLRDSAVCHHNLSSTVPDLPSLVINSSCACEVTNTSTSLNSPHHTKER